MQKYKGDDKELKMIAAGEPILSALSLQKDLFYAGAYETGPLGDLISLDNRSPLSNAIDIEIFRASFKEIFQTFVDVGTFESYLTVFRKIFGSDVGVSFTVPAPGKLTIAITATGTELINFVARYIDNNLYVFDEVVDWTPDNIAFQTIKGFQSQYELEQMLFEMVPAGIFTSISLTLGA